VINAVNLSESGIEMWLLFLEELGVSIIIFVIWSVEELYWNQWDSFVFIHGGKAAETVL